MEWTNAWATLASEGLSTFVALSIIIVCRERSQWQASVVREKSECLVEVSVMEQILREFPNPASVVREKSACLVEVSIMEQILREFPNPQKSWEN